MHILLLLISMFFIASPLYAQGNREIVIRLDAQLGGAYENGILILEFEIMSGDGPGGAKPTPTGNFRIIMKEEKYHSKKYDAPMPLSLFFTSEHAIHARGWHAKLPPRELRRYYSSHGCVSGDFDAIKLLFNWAPIGTPVTIIGDRTGD